MYFAITSKSGILFNIVKTNSVEQESSLNCKLNRLALDHVSSAKIYIIYKAYGMHNQDKYDSFNT